MLVKPPKSGAAVKHGRALGFKKGDHKKIKATEKHREISAPLPKVASLPTCMPRPKAASLPTCMPLPEAAHLQSVVDVLKELGVTDQKGLSEGETKKRLEKFGLNELEKSKKEPLVKRFLKQLADPMVILLIGAAIISAVTNALQGDNDISEVIIILFVVVLNSVLGVLQEAKAEQALEALQKLAASTSKVMREGRLQEVDSAMLVPGDIILLEAGDAVPADCRLIEAASLKVEESSLTGESVPVEKTIEKIEIEKGAASISLGDRKNMVYMGSTVAYGRGRALVIGTGMNTEMGKIAASISTAKNEKTPLQQKLGELSRVLTVSVVFICAFIFLIGFLRHGSAFLQNPELMMNTFMVAVSLAVAAIPEGLVAVVTIVLSLGVTKMSKRSAIVRKLTAVETLGCTQVICSDKTGTLTKNQMTVVRHAGANVTELIKAMVLASDAQWLEDSFEGSVTDSENARGTKDVKSTQESVSNENVQAVAANKKRKSAHAQGEPESAKSGYAQGEAENAKSGYAQGEPTEAALVADAAKHGLLKSELDEKFIRVGELPFDSNRKMMSVVVRDVAGGYVQYTKGAPDEVLKKCTYYLDANGTRPMTDEVRQAILDENQSMADEALRVLCAAKKRLSKKPSHFTPAELETGLTYIGLCGMIDPVRKEVAPAIEEAKAAGIRVIMITGDHIDTAVAIAKELGVIEDGGGAIIGSDLDKLSADELADRIKDYGVYARVQPEHKVRIVEAWKRQNQVVAMTGDGVNDAPSIKRADIGIGMGITGTDVTKNVADMVLADDNFATIVAAVEEGRRIYDNIRKAIQFLLSSNMAEVVVVFIATLMGFVILEPVQLLWINLITDSLPALALGMEKAEPNIMKRKPRKASDGIFANGMAFDIAFQGFVIAAITLASYFIGHYVEYGTFDLTSVGSLVSLGKEGTTMAFLTLSMTEMFHSFSMRSRRESIFKLRKQNWWLWGAFGLSLILTTSVIEVPLLAHLFGFAELDLMNYLFALGLAFLILPIMETYKAIWRAVERPNA